MRTILSTIALFSLCGLCAQEYTPTYGRELPRGETLAYPSAEAATAADGARLKVPHVGWDTITSLRSPLFDETAGETYVYYVHSFAAEPCAATIATTDYGRPFSAALGSGNFFGTQFHPEKSGDTGLRMLRAFAEL